MDLGLVALHLVALGLVGEPLFLCSSVFQRASLSSRADMLLGRDAFIFVTIPNNL